MEYFKKFVVATIKEHVNESVEELPKHVKYKLMLQNKPIIVYRGVHESGKNFYQGDQKLPFTYYSLTKEKAEQYGEVKQFIFNENSLPIKIFKGNDLFDKFGLNGNVENKDVIETLTDEGYSAVLIKGDELVVYDESLIKKI